MACSPRAQAGDESAWRELYASCYPKVIRVIRRRLNSPAMRRVYDSTDFAGDVWQSLAAKCGRFDFPNVAALQAFLVVAAERKVIDEHRRLHAQRNELGGGRPPGLLGDGLDPPSHDPSPSQVAVEHEAWEQLLDRLSEDERRVLLMKREGHSNEEIAEAVGWHVRKVQRFFKDHGESWLADRPGGMR